MQSVFQYIQQALSGLYPDVEIKSFSYLIVEKLTGFSRTEIILNKNTHFSLEQQHVVERFVEKLKKHEPIQYVLGETEFYGLNFQVNESVLIPRPETEELVEWISKEHDHQAPLRILDIGTGSGCIAVTLKSIFPNAVVDAFDVSPQALQIAQNNALKNKMKVYFSEVDILNTEYFPKNWDIIVSNPPYIPECEKAEIMPNVLDYEPHLALFVPDNDPLLFYRKIAQFALHHLIPTGKLFFEIHRDAGKSTCDLLLETGFSDIQLRKDIATNDRMIKALKKER